MEKNNYDYLFKEGHHITKNIFADKARMLIQYTTVFITMQYSCTNRSVSFCILNELVPIRLWLESVSCIPQASLQQMGTGRRALKIDSYD